MILNEIMNAAAEVQSFCENQGWKFCFIGGLAVQRWGMPRFTQDVDLTLLTGFGSEGAFIDAILRQFTPRRRDAREFALQRRVLLARTTGGVDLDFSLGALAFEEGAIARASLWQVDPNVALNTCSAEDLVIHKVFAGRDRDWSDVEGVLIRQHGRVNLVHIRNELPPLLELRDDTESFPKLERLIATIEKRLRQ